MKGELSFCGSRTRMKDKLRRLYWNVTTTKLDGVGVVEIILILVIIIGLVLIFKNQIVKIVSDAFSSINNNSSSISNNITITP